MFFFCAEAEAIAQKKNGSTITNRRFMELVRVGVWHQGCSVDQPDARCRMPAARCRYQSLSSRVKRGISLFLRLGRLPDFFVDGFGRTLPETTGSKTRTAFVSKSRS